MESGSWEVRVEVSGTQGIGRLAVPVPAFARRILPMQKALARCSLDSCCFSGFGIVSIAGAAAREGGLRAGAIPSPRNRRLGRIAMAVAGSAGRDHTGVGKLVVERAGRLPEANHAVQRSAAQSFLRRSRPAHVADGGRLLAQDPQRSMVDEPDSRSRAPDACYSCYGYPRWTASIICIRSKRTTDRSL